jgi:hypothetical protein
MTLQWSGSVGVAAHFEKGRFSRQPPCLTRRCRYITARPGSIESSTCRTPTTSTSKTFFVIGGHGIISLKFITTRAFRHG